MNQEIIIKEHVIHVSRGQEFVVFDRHPDSEGMQNVTLSIPVTPKIVDLIESAGIVEVVEYSNTGKLSFKRKSFYETHLMVEILADILEKHAN